MEAPVDPAKVLLINKPFKWTSFDVVKKIRAHFKLRKVGHAGTLDPLATGLLILCTGKKTKEIQTYMDWPKEYTGAFTIGHTTPSYDLETAVENEKDISHITIEDVKRVAKELSGDIQQIPPVFSAIRVKGRRAYESARKGEELILEPRSVSIFEFEATFEPPLVKFRVVCSKGTYIRSLARDFGEKLGTGAYLSELCRTGIGEFTLDQAVEIEDLIKNESL